VAHVACSHEDRWSEAIRVWPPVAAMALATLLTPHGPHLWTFLIEHGFGPRPDIAEWQPVRLASAEGVVYALAATTGIAALACSRQPRRPALVIVFACAVVLPLVARRHAALFAIAGLAVAGEHVADAAGRAVARWWPRGSRAGRDRRRAITWVLLAEAVVLLALAVPRFRQIDVVTGVYPVDAVHLLRASESAGRLAIWFDWGQYALWHVGPRIQVSIDGRRETVYTDRVRRENLMFSDGLDDWQALLTRYDTDLALLPTGSPAANLLRLEPRWRVLHEDRVGALFARADWPGAPALAAARSTIAPGSANGVAFP
jgi:hypothetical protein